MRLLSPPNSDNPGMPESSEAETKGAAVLRKKAVPANSPTVLTKPRRLSPSAPVNRPSSLFESSFICPPFVISKLAVLFASDVPIGLGRSTAFGTKLDRESDLILTHL